MYSLPLTLYTAYEQRREKAQREETFFRFTRKNYLCHQKQFKLTNMIIAVDFDGTIVEHRYPEIGREIPFAVETLKKLIEDRHQLILWSVREGRLLDEAVEWCRQRGVEFYAVNKDFPEEDTDKNRHYSRKLKADLFIDDRNLGGLPDWGTIYRMIKEKKSMAKLLQEEWEEDQPVAQKKKKRWWF